MALDDVLFNQVPHMLFTYIIERKNGLPVHMKSCVFSGKEKSELKKSIITLSVAAAVSISTVFAGIPAGNVQAASIQELKDQKSEIQSKSSGINNEINSADAQLNNIQAQQDQVTAEVNKIDLMIGETTTKISEKNQEIDAKNAEINVLKGEIEVLIEKIEQRNELLKERARSYQENGMVSYVDVLIGAQSFSDFIGRIGAVATIMEADQDIMKQHNEDKKALESKQAQVEKDKAALEKMRQDLETLNKDLDVQKQLKNQLMASLQQQEAQVSQLKFSLEEEKAILSGQEAAIQKAIELEQQRQAELRKQQEAAAAAARARGGSSSSAIATVPVSSGTFTRPAAGSITSGFGYRGFNGGGFHYGVDIAKSGTVPVVAAADGVVIRSYLSSSYGNCIMIAHSVGGQTYTTVYAHLNSRSVEDGAVVSKGQQIGYMGNTGDSYGQHLHFELHRGAWNAGKTNAINPVGIVPM